VDPRQQRTTDALRGVIMQIATEEPIEQVAVAEIARRAKITRSTFYNQTTSPAALLTQYLSAELDAVREGFVERVTETTGSLADMWAASEQELVDHLVRHAAIYERSLAASETGRLGPTLRSLLADHIEQSLREHLTQFPQVAPESNQLDRDMYAAFLAHGIVGTFEVWLRSPAPRDSTAPTRIILDSMPPWWFEPLQR